MARIVVTGVFGCIGTWVTRLLVERGHRVVGCDVARQEQRHRQLVAPLPGAGELVTVDLFDIADTEALRKVVTRERPDAVIHLAALQLPFCKADPIGCINVNVRGTMNLLEQAREHGFNLVYASSTAVYGPGDGRPFDEHERLESLSLYGVLKRTNEDTARIYGRDWNVNSVGLRPWTVYGPGRDAGLTADVTLALHHAARSQPYRIRFSGKLRLSHVADTAAAFVAPALDRRAGAHVHTLGGAVHETTDCVALIEQITGNRGLITVDPDPLGIACETGDESYQAAYGPLQYRPLGEGLRDTLATWRSVGAL